jgi:hypothetical protein
MGSSSRIVAWERDALVFWYDCYCFRERACILDCSRSVVSSVIKVMEVPLYPLLACYASVPSKPLLSSEGSLPKRV